MNILELIRNEKVEWKKLWEVTIWDKKFSGVEKFKQPKTNKYHYYFSKELKDLYSDYGTVKILTTNKTKLYAVEKDVINNISEGEIICIPGGGNPIIQYYKGKFITTDNRIATSTDTNVLNTKFLYYFLLNKMELISSFYRGAGIKHPEMQKILEIEIPIPPLSTQEKIVEILDKFTKHTTELQSELQSELQLRKKQYEYYREKLLTFDDTIERKKLCDLLDYEQPTKYIVNSTEYNNKHITPVLTAGQTFILGYTDEKDNIYMASKDNPVIIFDDFTSSNHWVDFNFKIKSSAMKILKPKENVNFRYCYYCIKMINIDTTEHKRLWISTFSQIEIPIPPIEIQEYIVNTLDKLDTLVNDITCGLPKEIELRQKQYEYYRSKLLDFKKEN